MMFNSGKSVLAYASVVFALAAQASAHAIPNPALGVKGTPQRSDVQRPSTASPCGSVNIANNLDTSTATPVAADGTVTIQIVDFNAGADGSTAASSVEVDATGTGKSFVAGTIKTNGNPNPTKVESDKFVFALPANTKCTGGKNKNLCLVSVKTTAGFGACTVVSQGAGSTNNAAATTTAKAAAKATTTTKAAAKAVTTTTTKAATVKTTTVAAAKATATAKSNKGTTSTAAKAKTQSKTNGKKHHHKGKGKGKGKGKKAAANKTTKAAASTTSATSTAKKMMRELLENPIVARMVVEELTAELARRDVFDFEEDFE